MNQLVVGALQKGGVDRHHRFVAFAGQAGGEGQRMLLGDAGVKVTLGKTPGKFHQPGSFAHGRSDGQQPRVGGRHVAQPVAEHAGVGDGLRFGLHLAGVGVKGRDAVERQRIALGRMVAAAFLRHHVQKSRAFKVAHVAQCRNECFKVVAVNGADVVKAEFLEQRAGHHHAFHVLLPAAREFFCRRQRAEHHFAAFAHRGVRAAGQNARQIVGNGAHIR